MALLTFPKARNKAELIGLLLDELAMLSHRRFRSQQLDAIHFAALMSSVLSKDVEMGEQGDRKHEKKKKKRKSF